MLMQCFWMHFKDLFLMFMPLFRYYSRWTGSEVGKREGVGSGKVCELGHELRMPEVQRYYMSVCCPQGHHSDAFECI